jgi:hypothetical protein
VNFITLLGGVAAWPIAARAQQPGGIPCVVHLTGQTENDPEVRARRAAFQEGSRSWAWSMFANIDADYGDFTIEFQ